MYFRYNLKATPQSEWLRHRFSVGFFPALLFMFSWFFNPIAFAQDGNDFGWMSAIHSLLLEDSLEVSEPDAVCEQSGLGVSEINLGDDDSGSSRTCLHSSNQLECVKRRLRSVLPSTCRSKIDVFVPGTNQENGNWRQFTSLVSRSDNRASIALNYEHGPSIEYDKGVIRGFDTLPILLRAIEEEFSNLVNVRVYGHSKGSHIVALVADDVIGDPRYDEFKFYAFGQAKRTGIDIDERIDIKAGKYGDKGYITKLSSNLVGITWSNDEVHFYEGEGFNGLSIPQRWLFPGRVKSTTDEFREIPANIRIDHHGTYGGTFINENSLPYCRTGRWNILGLGSEFQDFLDECIRRDEAFQPFFWGHQGCREAAWSMLEEEGADESRIWIGASGPREEGAGCVELQESLDLDYELKYRYNRADQQCKLNLKIKFSGLNGRAGGGTISTSASDGSTFEVKTKTGQVRVPRNMNLKLETSLSEQNTDNPIPFAPDFKCEKLVAQTETYIQRLRVKIGSKWVTLIGNREGSNYPLGVTTGQNLTGWKKDGGEWRMEYDTVLNSIKIEGETNKNANGNFSKIIHLFD